MTQEELRHLTKNVGDAFYILDSEQFRQNFEELKAEFTKIYPN